ncbi:uncharacterized protein TRIADDRAFT_57633 [Trichoplax adhaerens]|uniref:FZ domain-containing protein n=1 Tax=Trichoplax adhaerens TaxID=10228 RepID=B3S001_TRIAD|nr:predicted protein [Trichoplax adhaerens]EDV23920.1 predicted protein [Trichoplax adhaerens]|eukprot:XP_002113446.1 predicted protein [Trichoplax adhaerens]
MAFSSLIQDVNTLSPTKRGKRSTVKAYSYNSLTSCANIGNIATYCGVNYPVPNVIKTDATRLVVAAKALVNYIKNGPQFNAPAACVNDIKNTYCSILFPRCDSKRNEVSFNTSNCINSYNNCPDSVKKILPSYINCDVIPKGAFYLNDCIKPPSFNLKNCPNPPSNVLIPRYLTMDPLLVDTSIPNLRSFMQTQGNNKLCIQSFVDFLCADIPFCSQDRTMLLTTATTGKCQSSFSW